MQASTDTISRSRQERRIYNSPAGFRIRPSSVGAPLTPSLLAPAPPATGTATDVHAQPSHSGTPLFTPQSGTSPLWSVRSGLARQSTPASTQYSPARTADRSIDTDKVSELWSELSAARQEAEHLRKINAMQAQDILEASERLNELQVLVQVFASQHHCLRGMIGVRDAFQEQFDRSKTAMAAVVAEQREQEALELELIQRDRTIGDLNSRIADLQAEISDLKLQLMELCAVLATAQSEHQELVVQRQELEQQSTEEVLSMSLELEEKDKAIALLQNELADKEQVRSTLQCELDGQRASKEALAAEMKAREIQSRGHVSTLMHQIEVNEKALTDSLSLLEASQAAKELSSVQLEAFTKEKSQMLREQEQSTLHLTAELGRLQAVNVALSSERDELAARASDLEGRHHVQEQHTMARDRSIQELQEQLQRNSEQHLRQMKEQEDRLVQEMLLLRQDADATLDLAVTELAQRLEEKDVLVSLLQADLYDARLQETTLACRVAELEKGVTAALADSEGEKAKWQLQVARTEEEVSSFRQRISQIEQVSEFSRS